MTLASWFVAALLFASAYFDWRQRAVPNQLVIPSLIAGFLFQCLQDNTLLALSGMGTAFGLTLLPVLLKGMGMGDQKLLMAVGVWLSADEVYLLFLYSICFALSSILLYPAKWRHICTNLHQTAIAWVAHRKLWLPDKQDSALSLPYAVCLLLAYLYWWLSKGSIV